MFIHEKSFVNGVVYSDYQKGDCISFVLMESECNKTEYTGWKVAEMDYNEKQGKILDADSTFELITRIRKSLYFPVIQVWNDGRSICDNQCPMGFSERIVSNIRIMKGLLINNRIPDEIKGEIHFLLSCMHKDAPDECIQWIKEQVESGKIRDHQAIGFALGDVTETWQRNIFDQLVGSLNDDTLYVFAYAIWQDRHFVELFSLSQYHSILDHLMNMLANIKPCTSSKKGILRNWARATAEPLELLLGLLRTRSSSNVDIKMLLQPHQKITKSLAEQVERVADIVAKSHATLFSRVQLGNLPPKPDGDRTPDLLYALRLYLTGDDGANAIQITSVSDGDSE